MGKMGNAPPPNRPKSSKNDTFHDIEGSLSNFYKGKFALNQIAMHEQAK